MSFSNKEFEQFSTASLITRTTNDVQQIQQLLATLFRSVIYAPIIGIGGIITAFSMKSSYESLIVQDPRHATIYADYADSDDSVCNYSGIFRNPA